mmetsp:Transcript_25399/g.37451  ORF Transcript_25399/g.37451 Transcript_25399/m.37451 type:complete len:769 (+) Transcript_25399:116-2422(+)|eukprot:CAMPEP_0185042052 /NCGR_PEP_ID=MMETSP1103-20130426/42105_1 /TAXON_ID=36769 /ORGANISM="Paraphysomonas bandaiensis, Strain Caron Lab Isolate" /LENGTH=768 /DNA_ID=CAMNT_0027582047 /DNA_START=34 /DNA_END=2340 /DNA_ORIENTATION=+
MLCFYLLSVCLLRLSVSSDVLSQQRELYEEFPVEGGHYSVGTVSRNISQPAGVEVGYFKGTYGCFVSSLSLQAIYFINAVTQQHNIVAGTPFTAGNLDGQLLFSTFSLPTRMAYDESNNRLFVTEKRSGLIRVLDFPSDQTRTMTTYVSGYQEVVQFQKNVQSGGYFPGLDVQISGDVLYVVDTVQLYAITSTNGLRGVMENAIVTVYTSLSDYLSINGYPLSANLRSCIYSVAPDEKRKVLYVAISFAKNVILQVPMDTTEPYTSIIVLVGDESRTFRWNVAGDTPPYALNGLIHTHISSSASNDGNIGSSSGIKHEMSADGRVAAASEDGGEQEALLSFPIHIRVDSSGGVIYFTEAYPNTMDASYLFGSLTVRRVDLNTGVVDTYSGIDFSYGDNTTTYTLIGGPGGYVDSVVTSAEFAYPMSLCIYPSESERKSNKNSDSNFDALLVADMSNDAVRKVYAYMNTFSPTPSPTTELPPTPSPSQSPTAPGILGTGKLAKFSNGVVFGTAAVGVCICQCVLVYIFCFASSKGVNKHVELNNESGHSDIDMNGQLEMGVAGRPNWLAILKGQQPSQGSTEEEVAIHLNDSTSSNLISDTHMSSTSYKSEEGRRKTDQSDEKQASDSSFDMSRRFGRIVNELKDLFVVRSSNLRSSHTEDHQEGSVTSSGALLDISISSSDSMDDSAGSTLWETIESPSGSEADSVWSSCTPVLNYSTTRRTPSVASPIRSISRWPLSKQQASPMTSQWHSKKWDNLDENVMVCSLEE